MSKSIVEKLNLLKYKRPAVLELPEGSAVLAGLEQYVTELQAGSRYDLIFAFALDMESLQKLMAEVIAKDYLEGGGYLFAAYPKKGNKMYPTYIHRDSLFEGLGADEEDGYIGSSSIKFARMAGLDDVFTVVGFKSETRKEGASVSKKPSQSIADYAAQVADIEEDLKESHEVLAFYQSLTPGYRKDWARYVYSAVQEETRNKRKDEMKMILGEGCKSIDLYRRRES